MAARKHRRKKHLMRRLKRDMRSLKKSASRDWRGQPRRHARASALGWRRTAKSGWRPKRSRRSSRSRRDPSQKRDWRGQPLRHGKAAALGWRRREPRGWKPKHPTFNWPAKWITSIPKSKKRRSKRDWRGQPRRHAKARAYGWRRSHGRGWRPKHPTFNWPAKWMTSIPVHKKSRAFKMGAGRRRRRKPYSATNLHPHSWMRLTPRKARSRKSAARDWRGQPRRHARASHLGWKRHAKRGWKPKWQRSSKRRGR